MEVVGRENVISVGIEGAPQALRTFGAQLLICSGSYLPESTYFTEVCHHAAAHNAVRVFWATEDPYEQDANYRIQRDFDVIFSCDSWGSLFYQHLKTFHLPLAASKTHHYREIQTGADRKIDVMFCGVAFSSRKAVVNDLWSELSKHRLLFVGPGWGGLGPGFSDRRIEKEELIDLYTRSKVVLNLGRSLNFENHRFKIAPSTPGPRTFEAAMAGAVQLFHEDTFEMRRYFSSSEVPSFSGSIDFPLLLQSMLSDPQIRAETAAAAQKRAISEHTYAHRASSIISQLQVLRLL